MYNEHEMAENLSSNNALTFLAWNHGCVGRGYRNVLEAHKGNNYEEIEL